MTRTYKIVRVHFHSNRFPDVVLERGMSLEDAKAHCRDKNTSSRTCTDPALVAYTEKHGAWFDLYTEE